MEADLKMLLVVTCLSWFVLSQSAGISEEKKRSIREYVEAMRGCHKIPGASIAVVYGNSSWTEGFGKSDYLQETKVTSKTKFCIGSSTKSMASTLLALLLADHPQYNWETPAVEIIPELRWNETWLTDHITLTDLVSHRLGMPRYDYVRIAGQSLTKDYIVKALPYLTRTHQPRTKFMYNNNVYLLTGVAAERIGGDTFENLMRRHLLTPLGMENSEFIYEAYPEFEGFSDAFMLKNGEVEKINMSWARVSEPSGPGGGLCSSAEDMAKYLAFHLDPKHNGIKNSAAVDTIYKPCMAAAWGARHWVKPQLPITQRTDLYSRGLFSGYYRGYPMLEHGGSLCGFETQMKLLRSNQLGVYVSINGPLGDWLNVFGDLLTFYIMDTLLEEDKEWLAPTIQCHYPGPLKQLGLIPLSQKAYNKNGTFSRDPEAYVGTYGHYGLGYIKVTFDEDARRLKLWYGEIGEVQLWPSKTANDTFEYEAVGETYWTTQADAPNFGQAPDTMFFITDANDAITGLSAHFLDPEHAIFVRNLNMKNKPDYSQDSGNDCGVPVTTSEAASNLAKLFTLVAPLAALSILI